MVSSRPAPESWLRRFDQSRKVGPRLVVLPHAGGTAGFYRPLSAACAEWFEVTVAQYPGRLDRIHETPLSELPVLADRLTEALLELPHQPTALFGHSMGAVLGFETARRLAEAGRPSMALFVSACAAPRTRPGPEAPPLDDAQVLAELAALGGTDSRLLRDEGFLRMCLPAVRADLRALADYQCGDDAVVGCGITALVGDSDPRTSAADVLAWRARTTGDFMLHVLCGGHFYLVDHIPAVARLVAAVAIAQATPRLPTEPPGGITP